MTSRDSTGLPRYYFETMSREIVTQVTEYLSTHAQLEYHTPKGFYLGNVRTIYI